MSKEIRVNYYNIPVVPGIDDGNAQDEKQTYEKVHYSNCSLSFSAKV